jgi:hypothetical protein
VFMIVGTAETIDCPDRADDHTHSDGGAGVDCSDDAVAYSTGISLLIRPRSIPCRLRTILATT